MKLRSLQVEGFGRLADRSFDFAPGLNVVVGPNEAGKSTLAAALVASLYGLQRGEKDRWRPWAANGYGTVLRYETADGAGWEVHRAYDRDGKGIRVYDDDGNDAAARIGSGKSLIPGEAHLRIPLEVFLQTACVRQRAIGFDGSAASAVSTALAQALDGGPKEDAAIGAIERLDAALREHVGTKRAHKNAPLRALRDEDARLRRTAEDARFALAGLAELRERIGAARGERDRAAAAAAELERRARALRAAQLRARITALKEYRDELAALQTTRAAFDDVAAFAADRVADLDDAFHSWRAAQSVADAANRDVAADAPEPGELDELAARTRDAGSLDDDAFEALRSASAQAEAAHARAAAAGNDAAAARREGDDGRMLSGGLVATAFAFVLGDVGVLIAHLWVWAAFAGTIAFVLGFAAVSRARARAARRRSAGAKAEIADAALAEERRAADAVAGVLDPLGVVTFEELVRRRHAFVALSARAAARRKTLDRAQTARASAAAEAERYDALAATLVPDVKGSREERREAARRRAARRRERDGLDNSLAMLTMRRGDILRGEDEFALQADFDALVAAGVEPAAKDEPAVLRSIERERAELEARAHDADLRMHSLEGELRTGEQNVPDVAALDESVAAAQAQIARLEAFERAVTLARKTIDVRKDEAHRGFARRLEEYSAGVLGTITAGRYGEIHLDAATLAVRVRIPETGAIEDIEHLSAGTGDQVALVVRFATARMFAEGLERPPLLLDDPFAFWDAERIARCLPVLIHGALEAQTIVFTASAELAEAAASAGARRIDLNAVALTL
ncbi:MAG: hypothetical protein JWO85_3368 [Candidatus Eremiobacteraeota bacterium]|nr:hypothetical protein [Candidatus Eremiobacteraeota bacterium]